jgi:Leucine-rich repeat (LRR) protein
MGIIQNKCKTDRKSRIEFPVEVWRIILNHLSYHAIRLATVSKIFYHQIVFQSVTDLAPLFNHCKKKYTKFNHITDDIIKQFPNLEKLDLDRYNGIHQITEIGLTSLKNLTYLKFDREALESEDFEGVKELLNLKTLSITYNNGIKNKTIKSLTNLTNLNLARNRIITDEGIEELYNITTLICNPIITDRGISKLTNITTLKIAHIVTSDINDGLKNLLKITYLDLSANPSVTDDTIKYLTNMTNLQINFNENITMKVLNI